MSLPACVEYDRLLSLIVRPSNAADQGRRLVLGRHWVEALSPLTPPTASPANAQITHPEERICALHSEQIRQHALLNASD